MTREANQRSTAVLADRELEEWVEEMRGGPATLDVDEVRAQARTRALARRPRGPELRRITDLEVCGTAAPVSARLYEPEAARPDLIVYLHGGMWMLGDLETHDRTCRRLAEATSTRILAVDFRRAPEDPWPAAVDDALAAVAWASTALGADSPVLAGDSSGGHLALLVALTLRDQGRPGSGLLLACPNTDLRLNHRSIEELGRGWGLDVDSLRWAVAQWLPPGVAPDDPAVSPLLAELAGLPPTVLITADHDPLRDEGAALAEALRAAGVPVLHRCEPGMVHGFVQNLDLVSPAAARATDRFHRDARVLLG
ncbi:MAG TPA: alpha/beta hydrolase [Solirubrobacteraceae bacterium]|nr:alpha/beta hydrolase [Solirubrobacteraceae bacterium]